MTGLFLFVTGLVGGALNAVAGGGAFVAVPALIHLGVSPVAANATSTLAMWPGSAASAVAYRRELMSARRWLLSLIAVSLVGGLLGGALLVRTSDVRFLRLLPWLMLIAAFTFTFGSTLTASLRDVARRSNVGSGAWGLSRAPFWILAFQLVIATYGGYFGGGMGIMMLAAFSIAGMEDIHEMNGLKTVLAVAINGVALVEFVLSRVIAWPPGIVMMAGGILGGYAGAAMARRLDPLLVRRFVIAVAWVMTAYFFVL